MTKPPALRQDSLSVRSRIYRTLYDSRSLCSRRTLAESCAVSMPTLYQNLNKLIDEGLVCISGEEQSTGGRRAKGLEIVPDARFSVGISVSEARRDFSESIMRDSSPPEAHLDASTGFRPEAEKRKRTASAPHSPAGALSTATSKTERSSSRT